MRTRVSYKETSFDFLEGIMAKKTPDGLFTEESFDAMKRRMVAESNCAFTLRHLAQDSSFVAAALFIFCAWVLGRSAFHRARLMVGQPHCYGGKFVDRLYSDDKRHILALYERYGKEGERHLLEYARSHAA